MPKQAKGAITKTNQAQIRLDDLEHILSVLKAAQAKRKQDLAGAADAFSVVGADVAITLPSALLNRLVSGLERVARFEEDPFDIGILATKRRDDWDLSIKVEIVREVKTLAAALAAKKPPTPEPTGEGIEKTAADLAAKKPPTHAHIAEAIDQIAADYGLSGTDGGTLEQWFIDLSPYV